MVTGIITGTVIIVRHGYYRPHHRHGYYRPYYNSYGYQRPYGYYGGGPGISFNFGSGGYRGW
jgi:hypothetical protein